MLEIELNDWPFSFGGVERWELLIWEEIALSILEGMELLLASSSSLASDASLLLGLDGEAIGELVDKFWA